MHWPSVGDVPPLAGWQRRGAFCHDGFSGLNSLGEIVFSGFSALGGLHYIAAGQEGDHWYITDTLLVHHMLHHFLLQKTQ